MRHFNAPFSPLHRLIAANGCPAMRSCPLTFDLCSVSLKMSSDDWHPSAQMKTQGVSNRAGSVVKTKGRLCIHGQGILFAKQSYCRRVWLASYRRHYRRMSLLLNLSRYREPRSQHEIPGLHWVFSFAPFFGFISVSDLELIKITLLGNLSCLWSVLACWANSPWSFWEETHSWNFFVWQKKVVFCKVSVKFLGHLQDKVRPSEHSRDCLALLLSWLIW